MSGIAAHETDMNRERFDELVFRAIEKLPAEFRDRLENVDIVVEDRASASLLKKVRLRHYGQLLGLYQGVPQTRRGVRYGMVLPDRIYIFQEPIEAMCHSEEETERKIAEVVRHEIAHHFGTDEKTLRQIESNWRRKEH